MLSAEPRHPGSVPTREETRSDEHSPFKNEPPEQFTILVFNKDIAMNNRFINDTQIFLMMLEISVKLTEVKDVENLWQLKTLYYSHFSGEFNNSKMVLPAVIHNG